ncbi:MAG: hybrid sensor histidine kinase/response regulator [Sporocytophaga sp.]|uniref:hybrid sensor histidine kinase/response regulator n=1 Tax=Sporocytophaga sp. TaxID=2231183 RepID=UPI001B2DD19B|nr:hybrid sensor histidine kinase/response regulator [Sporocytophaga sp.]MBO9699134.1 hybrid sensor histidine kinase/response regulator [Sporocytophaga sp.]
MEDKIRVLYVDDDEYNLRVFKASFRFDYQIFLAKSAKEGLEVLKDNEIHVIIADQKMPEVTGVQFFESLISQYPETIRILLTGYSDIESVIDAINKGKIFYYIKKPWNETDIKLAIEKAGEIYLTKKLLKKRTEDLQKANEELTRFVYSASHELKAPLMTIIGVLKVADMDQNKTDDMYLSMIEKSVKNLDLFVRNIVNYYKNSRIEETLSEINFDQILDENIKSFDGFNGINFAIDIVNLSPFKSDDFRIKVILNNILSNAVKYQKKDNPEKKIEIKIHTTPEKAEISITDNGIGIQEKHLPSIFKMFFRGTHYSDGSGIGLYIAKEAVDKLNGSIKVESEEGKFTRFMIEIPNSFATSLQAAALR